MSAGEMNPAWLWETTKARAVRCLPHVQIDDAIKADTSQLMVFNSLE